MVLNHISRYRSSIKGMQASTSQGSSSNRTSGLYYGMQQGRRGITIDDGPPSLPMSSMPPLRDSNYSNNITNYNNLSGFPSSLFSLNLGGGNYNNSNLSSKSLASSFSGSPSKAGALALQSNAISSPSRYV